MLRIVELISDESVNVRSVNTVENILLHVYVSLVAQTTDESLRFLAL